MDGSTIPSTRNRCFQTRLGIYEFTRPGSKRIKRLPRITRVCLRTIPYFSLKRTTQTATFAESFLPANSSGRFDSIRKRVRGAWVEKSRVTRPEARILPGKRQRHVSRASYSVPEASGSAGTSVYRRDYYRGRGASCRIKINNTANR